MEGIKVSVIVPVFNSERYLEQCINSIIAQTLNDIEIVCVNDGSSDCSLEILDRIQKQDSRIHVYSQSNSGVGAARNNGMRHASGEYIAFLDSDDYFKPDALEKAYITAKRNAADICVFGMKYYSEDYGKAIQFDVLPGKITISDNKPFSISDEEDHILNFAYNLVWNKIYKRTFLESKHIEFPLIKRGEDLCFVHLALCLAEKIMILREALITYRFLGKKV